MTDAQKVAADLAALKIQYNGTDKADRVTQPLQALPAIGANNSTIKWLSGAPTIVSNDGKTVNRPVSGNGDVIVIMTAIVTNNTAADTKTFQLTVKQQLTDAQKVASDKTALEIDFAARIR